MLKKKMRQIMLVAYPIFFLPFFLSNRNLILCLVKSFISQPSLQMGVTKYRPRYVDGRCCMGLLICVSGGGC